jgi:hypothetical protein
VNPNWIRKQIIVKAQSPKNKNSSDILVFCRFSWVRSGFGNEIKRKTIRGSIISECTFAQSATNFQSSIAILKVPFCTGIIIKLGRDPTYDRRNKYIYHQMQRGWFSSLIHQVGRDWISTRYI